MRLLPVLGLAASPFLARCEASGELRPEGDRVTPPVVFAQASHELKVERDRRWILAKVRVADTEVWAAFDTGLSVSALIDEQLCRQLELPMRRGLWSRDGASGSGYKRGALLPELAWDSFSAREVRALRGDLSFLKTNSGEPVQLILGCPLFRGWLQQIDLAAGRLRLIRGELPAIGEHPHVIAVRRSRGVPFCALRVGPRVLRLLLDTGYDGSLALPGTLRTELELRGEARRTGRVRTLLEEGGAIWAARLAGTLQHAGYELQAPAVQFLEGYEHAVLGRQALDAWILTLDLRNGRALFEAVPPPETSPWADILSGSLLPREPSPTAEES